MFSIRRAALRFLSSPSTSFTSKTRTLSTLSPSPLRVSRQSILPRFQQRWATTGAEAQEAPVSKLQPTAAEEVENAISEDNAAAPIESASNESNATEMSDPPAAAETANMTEATEEAIPAAEEPVAMRSDPAYDAFGAREERPRTRSFGASEREPKRTVYVGNLFFDVTEDDVTKELARFGTIQNVKLIRDARGLSKGFGYVTFANVEQATRAIAGMHQQVFEGRRLNVQYATIDAPPRRPGKSFDAERPTNPPSKTLFIGNMSYQMTDKDLNEMFRSIKNVLDVRVAIDRRTGQPRGFAHADFIDVKSAMDGMKVLQGKESYGRRLRCDYSYGSSSAPRNQARDDGMDGPSDRS